ncbi:MAG: hypothetical protein KDB18_08705 [Salinibacterium sp.]|nr:hypothetical protein [Salinibacterium sp.]
MLDALETADEDIERVSSSVLLVTDYALSGDQDVRTGSLQYRRTPGQDGRSLKQFKVRFDQTITGQVIDKNPREYIFDGEWLVEKFVNEKQFIKRQMVPPGEHWDPLRLGEGPFPVPIGQRRDDILSEYIAELASDAADGLEHARLIEQSQDTYQLVLRPRPAFRDTSDFDLVRIWYDTGSLLPKMIRADKPTGDVTTVILRGLATGDSIEIPNDLFDTTPPKVGEGWDVSVEPWRTRDPLTGTVEGAERREDSIKVEGGR